MKITFRFLHTNYKTSEFKTSDWELFDIYFRLKKYSQTTKRQEIKNLYESAAQKSKKLALVMVEKYKNL